ncbi:hypothetical protein [Comamonas sp. JC664]|uniref:hypothetical protein n=1 Tax=Comamonas sp. JC664 TaxID=2801917 RepID=UPI003672B236
MVASAASPRSAASNAQGLVQQQVTVGQNSSIMLRDPRLDELLAHAGRLAAPPTCKCQRASCAMPLSMPKSAAMAAPTRLHVCADDALNPSNNTCMAGVFLCLSRAKA